MPKTNADTHQLTTIRKYRAYGAMFGACLGFIAGLLVSGPHFKEWSVATTVFVLAGCTLAGAITGFIAPTGAPYSGANSPGSPDDTSDHKPSCTDDSNSSCESDGH